MMLASRRPFHYKSKDVFAVVGHRNAVGIFLEFAFPAGWRS